MKFPICTIISLMTLVPTVTYAQNMVPNPSFEDYSELPDIWGQWDRCDLWSNAGGDPATYYGDPDYFHTAGSGSVQLPNTAPATVEAHTGEAIMGFLGYHNPDGANIREYIMVELDGPMNIGQHYAVSFWITNGFSSIGHYLKCDGIGINFSTTPLNQDGESYIDRTPQLEIEGELFVTEWQEINFTFIADSSYTHLTIGNFYSDAETNTSLAIEGPLPFAGAYYFVDDFNVEKTEDSNIGLLENKAEPTFLVFPNPTNDFVQIELKSAPIESATYILYGIDGQVLETGTLEKSTQIDFSQLATGTYLIDIVVNGEHTKQQIIKE
ncbi:MAG: hypothetical protein ACI8ZM_001026 [Crocinitomix sp.]|jgi:hypothetical protein